MSEVLTQYRKFLDELKNIRQIHNGQESIEEDELLEQMDSLWRELTEKEKEEIQSM